MIGGVFGAMGLGMCEGAADVFVVTRADGTMLRGL